MKFWFFFIRLLLNLLATWLSINDLRKVVIKYNWFKESSWLIDICLLCWQDVPVLEIFYHLPEESHTHNLHALLVQVYKSICLTLCGVLWTLLWQREAAKLYVCEMEMNAQLFCFVLRFRKGIIVDLMDSLWHWPLFGSDLIFKSSHRCYKSSHIDLLISHTDI